MENRGSDGSVRSFFSRNLQRLRAALARLSSVVTISLVLVILLGMPFVVSVLLAVAHHQNYDAIARLRELGVTVGTQPETDFGQSYREGRWVCLCQRCVTEEHLDLLHSVTALELLNLDGTATNDGHLSLVADLKGVRELWLGHNQITDRGMAYIARMHRLRGLNLASTHISDRALQELGGLQQLQWLDLSDTSVTDAGIVDLQGLHNLRRLVIDGTLVTDKGLADLDALPNLECIEAFRTRVTCLGGERLCRGARRTVVVRIGEPSR